MSRCNQKPSFRFEIDNFSEKKTDIVSKTFVSGGCQWYLYINPKGYVANGHLSLYLSVAYPAMLPTGWKRSLNYYFVLLNQSDKELYRSSIGPASDLFCAERPSWGFQQTLPLSKFQEEGFLENDRLIIEVYIKVIEAVNGEDGDVSEKKKTVDVNGFQVLASKATKVRKIFTEHPDIAKDFTPTKQEVKTAYMNVLLKLVKTLQKPPMSLSETRLSRACSELSELMNVGFKLDWLKLKLEEVSLERKKSEADGSGIQQLEERVNNLDEVSLEKKKSDDTDESRAQQLYERIKNFELMRFKLDCLNTKLDEVSLERKKTDETSESRAQQLEERIKNLELMESCFKLDSLKSKIDEVSMKMKKADDADWSMIQQLDERIMNLEMIESGFKMDCLKSKLDEVSLKMKKTDEADVSMVHQLDERFKKSDETNESRAQQLEERVKNLELMELGSKLDRLNRKLDEVSLEKKKSYDVVESRVQQLEERVKDLGFKLDCLNTKLEEISLERMKTDDADGSAVQQLEESVKNIELMVSHLKVELDKKKDKSFADGFLLVDEVAY